MNEHSRPCTDAACRVSACIAIHLIKDRNTRIETRQAAYERDAAGRLQKRRGRPPTKETRQAASVQSTRVSSLQILLSICEYFHSDQCYFDREAVQTRPAASLPAYPDL
jgi:hypothetical protein